MARSFLSMLGDLLGGDKVAALKQRAEETFATLTKSLNKAIEEEQEAPLQLGIEQSSAQEAQEASLKAQRKQVNAQRRLDRTRQALSTLMGPPSPTQTKKLERREKELDRAAKQADRAQRMADKGQLRLGRARRHLQEATQTRKGAERGLQQLGRDTAKARRIAIAENLTAFGRSALHGAGRVAAAGEIAATSRTGAAAAAQAIGGAGELVASPLEAFGGPHGKAVGESIKMLTAFAAAGFKVIDWMDRFGKEVLSQEVQRYGQASPAMALVGQEAKIAHIMEDMIRGQALAGQAHDLARSQQHLDQVSREANLRWEGLKNKIAKGATDVLAGGYVETELQRRGKEASILQQTTDFGFNLMTFGAGTEVLDRLGIPSPGSIVDNMTRTDEERQKDDEQLYRMQFAERNRRFESDAELDRRHALERELGSGQARNVLQMEEQQTMSPIWGDFQGAANFDWENWSSRFGRPERFGGARMGGGP